MKTQIDVSWKDAAERWKAYADELERRIEGKEALIKKLQSDSFELWKNGYGNFSEAHKRVKELEVELAECREDCQRFADELIQQDNY